MQLTYIVACLAAYLVHMVAICQVHRPATTDEPSAKGYTLDQVIVEWKNNKCIFPDNSWYKVELGIQKGKLEHCQKVESLKDRRNKLDAFQYTLCQSLYSMSIQLCGEQFKSFVENCLSPVELANISLFNKDNDVCSYVQNQPNDYYSFMSDTALCKDVCEGSEGFKEICELYVSIFYQYKQGNKCMTRKATSRPSAAYIEVGSGKATTEKETVTSTAHIEAGSGKAIIEKQTVTSDNNAANNESIEASKPSKEDASNVLTTASKIPGLSVNNKTDLPSSRKLDEHLVQNDSPTPNKNQTESISVSNMPQEKPTVEAKTSVLIESTPTIIDTDSKEIEELSTATTTTIFPSSVQFTSTTKQIMQSLLKSTPQSEEVIDLDTPATTATARKNEDDTQNGNSRNDEDGGNDDGKVEGDTNNEDDDSEEQLDNEEQKTWDKNDEDAGGKQNPAKGNVNQEDNDHLREGGNKQKKQPQHRVKEDEDESPGSGHFLAYFLTAVVICISGYVIYHNKQKILAFVIEGRNSSRAGRQRSKDVKYTQLKSNVEEVLPSLEQSATSKNFVY